VPIWVPLLESQPPVPLPRNRCSFPSFERAMTSGLVSPSKSPGETMVL
jgi:hypothetical protein